ncbi:glycosyl hydrolase [Leptodontidium sp. 2 PMI_412]|nr:glycosyl hydrolase [Leptodontidium sp. 2 PMI_412]
MKISLTNITLLGALLPLTTAFQNPIRAPGPDPSVVYADGNYHLTYTSYNSITITRSQTLSGLLNGETKTIWTDSDPLKNANMWAPEIHQIDGTWYMFYSACNSQLPCWGPNKDFAFSIDGTYLEIPGKGRYHVLSIIDENNLQSVAITELDTEAWTVKGWNVISVPGQDWEVSGSPVNEGPHPLYHNGEIWLSYSGSFCGTPNYALGLLKYNGGDPLLRSSWNKTGPVLSQANGNYGTGHNCFFTSPDGTEIWNAFHATSNSGGSCGGDRYTMVQIVTFDDSNMPMLGVPQPLDSQLVAPSGE